MKRKYACHTLLALLLALTTGFVQAGDHDDFDALGPQILKSLQKRNVAGAGIAVIENGVIVWTGYYGEQAPGVAVDAATRFNTASIAKTVTAEAVLRLASAGKLELHDRIADHFMLSALAKDPLHSLLTPARILSHQAGLRNWPYAYEDGKLAFIAKPGTTFSYSGIGYEMLGLYLEARFEASFDSIVQRTVFTPLELQSMSVHASACREQQAAVPMTSGGDYAEPCSNMAPGDWSAADNLYTSVEDYARFMIAVMNDEGLATKIADARNSIHVSLDDDKTWHCDENAKVHCPDEYGYGLGWMIYLYGTSTVFKHGGNDFGESALAYFDKTSRDGAVIFVNGGNGIFVTVDVLTLLNQQPALAAYYQQLTRRHYGADVF